MSPDKGVWLDQPGPNHPRLTRGPRMPARIHIVLGTAEKERLPV